MMTGRSSTASSRRMRQEEQMVRRRNAEHDRAQLWNGVNNYYHDWSVRTSKINDWTSQEYYDHAEAERARVAEEAKNEREEDERRLELMKKLSAENDEYERQILATDPRKPLPAPFLGDEEIRKMSTFTQEMKRREEEARQREAQLKLHHHWRINEPVLRDFARNQHTSFVRDAWVLQVEDKRKEMEEKEKAELEAARKRELEAAEEEKKEKELEEARKLRALDLREQIMHQINELREKELQAEQLKQEEAEEIKMQADIEAIVQQRRLVEKKRVDIETSLYVSRQWQLKLRRRAREVQEELAADQLMLESLLAAEARDQAQRDEKRLQARLEMEAMRKMVAEQMEQEREVERNAHFIFQEEARRMWDKNEARWNAERAARRRLMDDVLLGLQQQIEQKLERNLEEQERLVGERESLLEKVEAANQLLKEEREQEARDKEQRRKEREKELAAKKMTALELLRAKHLETQKSILLEKQKEEKILQELRRMEIAGYQPQNVGRRILW